MRTPQQLYDEDEDFRELVDALTYFIVDRKFSPARVRNAADLAGTHYREYVAEVERRQLTLRESFAAIRKAHRRRPKA